MQRSILIIDDERSIQMSLGGALSDEGFEVHVASSGPEGVQILQQKKIDLVLLDVWMPGCDGLMTLEKIRAHDPEQIVVVMSGHGTIETAVRATKLGAYDFVEKPLSLEKLLVLLAHAFKTRDLSRENRSLRAQVQVQQNRNLIGTSDAMEQLRSKIKRVAPTVGSVLITGENGTGKELVAHRIHSLSQRFKMPFVAVNCAAIPEELIESELFGHEKGSFTGATQQRRGKFDLANEGTLFLDEIGDMSLRTQAKILRVLQDQKYERVGGQTTLTSDVRIVAATNKDLKAEMLRGHFREDLFYRLNVLPFHMVPLREHLEDVESLAEFFLGEASRAYARQVRSLSEEALRVLRTYSWPGNVRELKNIIDRTIILTHDAHEGTPIAAAEILEHLSTTATRVPDSQSQSKGLREAREEFEKTYIGRVLSEHDGNISKSATALGIERSHLHKKIKSYGLMPGGPADSTGETKERGV